MPLNKSRMDHAIVVYNQRMYALGGKNSLGLVHSIEKYNPDLNMWLVIKTNFEMRLGMNLCRGASRGVCKEEETVFIVGGLDTNSRETKNVKTISVKSPEFNDGILASMLEERIFPAIAIL